MPVHPRNVAFDSMEPLKDGSLICLWAIATEMVLSTSTYILLVRTLNQPYTAFLPVPALTSIKLSALLVLGLLVFPMLGGGFPASCSEI